MILKNAAYCRLCDQEIESKSVHDFQTCRGGHFFVDGGHEYLRYGSLDPSFAMTHLEDRSEVKDD